MKKSIVVFLLLIIICFLPNACKKEMIGELENPNQSVEVINENKEPVPIDQKEIIKECEKGYLFKTSYNDKVQIKQFNFETMKEELVGEFNSSIHNIANEAVTLITFSPDRKKFAFLGRSLRKELNNPMDYDLYVMNIDGSDLKRITFDMTLVPFSEFSDFMLFFTPDSQDIIVSCSWWNFSGKAIYLVNLAQNTCFKYDENNPLFWPMLSYVDQQEQLYFDHVVTPILPNGEEYLVWYQTNTDPLHRTELGTFNWKKKEYKKICSSPIPKSDIISAICSPDFSKIILKVDERNYPYEGTMPYHLFLYDIPHKSFVKIGGITQESEDIYSQYHVLDNWKYLLFFSDKKLWSYKLDTQQKTEVQVFDDYFSLFPIDEKRCIIQDHNEDVFLFISGNHSLKKLLMPENSSDFILLDNSLYFFANRKFAKYDLSSNRYNVLNNLSYHPFFLPERQLFCFCDEYYAHTLTILDKKGIQIAKINNIDGLSFTRNPRLIQKLKKDDFYYFTYQSKPSDLYYAKSIQGKPINLTQGKFPVLRLEVSPDQQNVAFYSLDRSTNMTSVHLLSLTIPDKVITLASFQLNYYEKDTPHEEYLYEDFLTCNWSKDSQWIYFVTRDAFKRFMIYRAKADGTGMTLLSDPKSSSFGSMVSPDGKQLVYVTGEERKIALMNTDGTDKKRISDGVTTRPCYLPAWSPDGKMIAFNQLMVEDRFYNFTSPSYQIMIITPQSKVITKIDCMFFQPREPKLESTQTKNYWSYSSDYFSCLQSVDNSGVGEGHYKDIFHVNIGEKKFSSSNLIQPTIHRFKWASSKELLMLFRWIDKKASHFTSWDWESHESNNTIQLYACCTKQFITVTKDVFYVFDAAWSPEDTEVLYAGTDIHSGQVVFKVAS